MKVIISIVIFLFVSKSSIAQLQKGSFLVGGSFNAAYSKPTQLINLSPKFEIFINPNLGYFIWDKLAAGINGSLSNSIINHEQFIYQNSNYSFGPFVKYYLLKKDNPINIFSTISYVHQSDFKNSYSNNAITVSVGSSIFLTKNIAFELTPTFIFNISNRIINNTFLFQAAFQIYLK